MDADPPEVKELTADTLRRQLDETRKLLGPYLSLYQIHSATLSSGVLDDAEVRRELDALRRDGVAVGASVSGTEQAETIDRMIALGGFDTVQATWNLLERSAGDARVACACGGASRRQRRCPCDRRSARASLGRHGPSGASTVAQLASNLTAFRLAWDPALDEELAPLVEEPEDYWNTRSALPWTCGDDPRSRRPKVAPETR